MREVGAGDISTGGLAPFPHNLRITLEIDETETV